MLTNWSSVGMGGVLISAWEKPSDDRVPRLTLQRCDALMTNDLF
jgi:hypothetical protein